MGGALSLGLAAVAGGIGLTFAARRRRAVADEGSAASAEDPTD